MPVVTAEGQFLGLVNEVDLLNYLVLGTGKDPDNAIAELVRSDVATLGPDAPLNRSCRSLSTARWRWSWKTAA